MNTVILIGNLTKDVEIRKTTSNKNVANFTVAINNGQNRDADFINCQAWEKTADVLGNYTHKGSKIAVEGSIKTQSYVNNQGQKVYKTFVQAYRIELLDSKGTSNNDYHSQGVNTYQNTNNAQNDYTEQNIPSLDIDSSDLPF